MPRIHHYTRKRLRKGFQSVKSNPEITLESKTWFALCTIDDLLAPSVAFKIVLISQNCHSKWISPVCLFNGPFVFTNKEMRHARKKSSTVCKFHFYHSLPPWFMLPQSYGSPAQLLQRQSCETWAFLVKTSQEMLGICHRCFCRLQLLSAPSLIVGEY